MGHSLGADNLVEMAKNNKNLSIDKMILLDIADYYSDSDIPDNVKDVTNFNQSNSFPSGEKVTADDPRKTLIENIPVQGSNHRNIDDNLTQSIVKMLNNLIESYNKKSSSGNEN